MYIMLWALGLLGPITLLVLHFTCTAHLCLLYKALMYIFSLRNTIRSSSISNMFNVCLCLGAYIIIKAWEKKVKDLLFFFSFFFFFFLFWFLGNQTVGYEVLSRVFINGLCLVACCLYEVL